MLKAIVELRTTQWDRKINRKNIWKNMFTVKSFKVFTSFILADARCPRLRTLSALGNQQKWSYLHRIQLQKKKKILSLYFKGKIFTKSIPDIRIGTHKRAINCGIKKESVCHSNWRSLNFQISLTEFLFYPII